MLGFTIILFLVTAVGGIALAIKFFKKQFPSAALATAHGLLAVVSMLMLVVTVITFDSDKKIISSALATFILAIFVGFYIVSRHFKKIIPSPIYIVIHALLAVSGVAMLGYVAIGI